MAYEEQNTTKQDLRVHGSLKNLQFYALNPLEQTEEQHHFSQGLPRITADHATSLNYYGAKKYTHSYDFRYILTN